MGELNPGCAAGLDGVFLSLNRFNTPDSHSQFLQRLAIIFRRAAGTDDVEVDQAGR